MAAAAVALVVAGLLHRASERGQGRVPKPSFMTRNAAWPPAARRTAIDFIHAVAVRDPAGWRLLDPTFPCTGHSRKRAWQARKLRFTPIPRFRHVRFEQPYVTQSRVLIAVFFDRRYAFNMSLKRHGPARWLVDWFDGAWSPLSATCPGQGLG